MPLRDHFHPPLHGRRHWHGFHSAWATTLSYDLNARLPEGYFAEPTVQFGIEIDVATWEEAGRTPAALVAGEESAGSKPTTTWRPPAPALTIPFPLVTDAVEVRVFEDSGGPTLVGALELVSTANKDRQEHRDAFVAKCESYLQQGVGLVVVDIVTDRAANLHAELLSRFAAGERGGIRGDLYAAAYRPVERDDQTSLDIWRYELVLGQTLPTMPLWLRGAICLPVDLEGTYERTCEKLRIDKAV